MAIKKVYKELIEFIQENSQKKVATILPQIEAMCSAQRASGATTFLKDVEGNVVAILDFYFKRWMPLVGEKAVEFGVKNGSSTGFNTMCKKGASLWTKQNREAKNAELQMLKDIKSGELDIANIDEREAEIEAAKAIIVPTELGFETKEEVVEYLESEGFELIVM